VVSTLGYFTLQKKEFGCVCVIHKMNLVLHVAVIAAAMVAVVSAGNKKKEKTIFFVSSSFSLFFLSPSASSV